MTAAKKKSTAKKSPAAREVQRQATRQEIYIIMGMTNASYYTVQKALDGEPLKYAGTRQIVLRAWDWVQQNEHSMKLAVQS